MSELKTGTRVKDRYTLKEFKGSGSFGEVWLAHDEILDSDVAIKIYISLDPRGVEEFKSEYVTTQGISHPNLLTTTYFDVWEQRPFLVMKYCANGSSSKQAGSMDEYALWQFIHDVAAGLKHLHSMPEPIIHQDIKPDNILIDDSGHYLITDFGISKKIRSTMRKQSKRAVGAGATAYMGPERFEGDPTPVKASDIWSLGVSIYELATGELPFSGLGGGMQRNGAVLPSLGTKWSKDMTMVMQSCLAKDTWDRPTAQQLEEYSDAILKGVTAKASWTVPSSAEGALPIEQETVSSDGYETGDFEDEPHSNKKRVWITVLGILAAIILLFVIWSSDNTDDEPIAVTEQQIESTDSITSDSESKPEIEVPEVEPQKVVQDPQPQAQKQEVKKDEVKPKPEDTKVDNNASILKSAMSSGDYQQIQKLANQGYAAAYGPLAKYYLSNHDYKTAETYAKKAKAAGFKDGETVLTTLKNLGYYD